MDVLERLGLKKRLRKLRRVGRELVVKGVPAEAKSFVLRGVPHFWEDPVFDVGSYKKDAD